MNAVLKVSGRRWVSLLTAAVLVFGGSSIGHSGKAHAAALTYDQAVLGDHPVGYWPLAPGATGDVSGHGMDGFFTGTPVTTALPNGDAAPAFNGLDQYFTIPDNDLLEVTRTGVLTIEAWMRPDVLQFPKSESSGYVHWMGKGEKGEHSWAARMYSYTNTEKRPNRISGYSFNLSGGLGAGSYFQDPVTAGEWIHYTLVINTVNSSSAYTTGYTKLYKNGVLRDQDRLSDYNIVPGNGTAPMRIGTRDLASFFEGAIGKVAVYDYELTADQLKAHVDDMYTQDISNDLNTINGITSAASVTAGELDQAITLYRQIPDKLAALPAFVDKSNLQTMLASAEPAIFNSIKSHLAVIKPGNDERSSELQLDFLVVHAITELGAQDQSDAAKVVDYVMSIVRSHAKGQQVNGLALEHLTKEMK